MKIFPINVRPILNKKPIINFKRNYTSDSFTFSGNKESKSDSTGLNTASFRYMPLPLPITPERKVQLEEFENRYGLKFNNIELLNQAFCYNVSKATDIIPHHYTYEQLEFIGDSVLNLCTTKLLQEIHGSYQEGRLTKLRENIVSNKSIAAYNKKRKT